MSEATERADGQQGGPAAVAEKERVAKVMARAGLCSRRDAEAWIKAGRVAVNGTVITSPALNIGPDEAVTVDGQPIARRERTRLFFYHKPRGLVTTAKDPEGRPTVFDSLPPSLPRLISVGRLDINTEGLLLLTNDGGLARVLELPATGWLRRYRVRANGAITQDRLDTLREGITIDGVDYAGIEAELDRQQGANVWLTMGLREGKNREIKRVLEQLGLVVNRLIRLSFGPFQLGELAEGGVEEVRTRVLKDQLGPVLAKEAGVDWEDDAPAPVVTRERESREQRSPRRPSEAKPSRSAQGPAADRPRIDKPQAKARPHVSALRSERASTGSEPRKKVNRATTEDRKGRTVRVERITVESKDRHAGPGGTSRNARNFARERRETEEPARTESQAPRRTSRGERPGGFGTDRPQTGRALKETKRGANLGRPEGRDTREPRTKDGPRRAGQGKTERPNSGAPRGPRTAGGPRRADLGKPGGRDSSEPWTKDRPRRVGQGKTERPDGGAPRGPRTAGGPRRADLGKPGGRDSSERWTKDGPRRVGQGKTERPDGGAPRGPRTASGPRRADLGKPGGRDSSEPRTKDGPRRVGQGKTERPDGGAPRGPRTAGGPRRPGAPGGAKPRGSGPRPRG